MKKIANLLVCAFLVATSLASCKKENTPAAPGISIDKEKLTIGIGETATLTATVYPEDVADNGLVWASSRPEVASVDNNGLVSGITSGEAVISVTATAADGIIRARCTVKVVDYNGHEYADLGLGVKWATCNVGAESPDEYGDYYYWGATEPWDYGDPAEVITEISGNPEYDAASANWGGSWRLPTRTECQELLDKCEWTWTQQNGHNGYIVTGSNGNSIFLPAAGYRSYGFPVSSDGIQGSYWSSTPIDTEKAYSLYFFNGPKALAQDLKHYAISVRPVSE